ncbi:MAG: NAD-dependent epimerase/dehydratase family protein [Planctomycetaceae bacterium]|nr:NAD-dependent epimerase/dehydratase family protein [Planctomycetaceae bacterium]
MRVLVTGTTGFVGWHLVKQLTEKGCAVRCLVRQSSDIEPLKPFNPEFCRGSLDEPDSLKSAVADCGTIFHLAGRVRANTITDFLKANQDGTKNLAVAALQQTVKRSSPPVFVYVSSLAAMGPSKKGKPKTETDACKPISYYGISKLAAEITLSELANVLPCSIVRPGIVFGERDKMNLEIFRTVRKMGFCPIPGWFDRIYSWIHVADLCLLLMLTAEKGQRITTDSGYITLSGYNPFFAENDTVSGQGIYLASNGAGRKLSEVGREIGKALGRKRTIGFRCPPMAVVAVSTYYEMLKRLTGKDQPYDWAKALESLRNWIASPEKTEEELGFVPLCSFAERIQQTADWYRQEKWL